METQPRGTCPILPDRIPSLLNTLALIEGRSPLTRYLSYLLRYLQQSRLRLERRRVHHHSHQHGDAEELRQAERRAGGEGEAVCV